MLRLDDDVTKVYDMQQGHGGLGRHYYAGMLKLWGIPASFLSLSAGDKCQESGSPRLARPWELGYSYLPLISNAHIHMTQLTMITGST